MRTAHPGLRLTMFNYQSRLSLDRGCAGWTLSPTPMNPCRSIILADLDAFFVSVETALRPETAGRACAVTGGGRGVVLSATYEARSFGVAAGMPVAQARQMCPGILLLPGRAAAYRMCADHLFSRMSAAGGVVERVSIDEAFWDVTGLQSPKWDRDEDRPGHGAVRWLRHMSRAHFGLTLSVGLASSKAVAKVASEQGKPNGEVVVPCLQDREYVAPLPVGVLPGVGPVAQRKLAGAGLTTVGQLAQADMRTLEAALQTRSCAALREAARGESRDPVRPAGPPKSVSAEVTSAFDVSGKEACEELFEQALSRALGRLRRMKEGARTVTVTHRSPSGKETSASSTLDAPTDDTDLLIGTARQLHWRLESPRLRLVGVAFAGLSPAVQLLLDGNSETGPEPSAQEHELESLPLSEIAYRGLQFDHDVFGLGRVEQWLPAGIAVTFPDRVRIMDPAAQIAAHTSSLGHYSPRPRP